MPDSQHKQTFDAILASIMRGFIIPLVGICAWAAMIAAFLFYDKPLDPLLISSALALVGVNRALDAFTVQKK